MIIYNRFFEYIKNKGYTQNELIREKIIDARLLNALKNNKSITTKSLDTLCTKLNCKLDDILEYIPNNNENAWKRLFFYKSFWKTGVCPREQKKNRTLSIWMWFFFLSFFIL